MSALLDAMREGLTECKPVVLLLHPEPVADPFPGAAVFVRVPYASTACAVYEVAPGRATLRATVTGERWRDGTAEFLGLRPTLGLEGMLGHPHTLRYEKGHPIFFVDVDRWGETHSVEVTPTKDARWVWISQRLVPCGRVSDAVRLLEKSFDFGLMRFEVARGWLCGAKPVPASELSPQRLSTEIRHLLDNTVQTRHLWNA